MSNVSMIDGHIDRPMTNYERIKNMSVEEMVDVLCNQVSFGAGCVLPINDCLDTSCEKCIKLWLESEVETE